MAKNIDWNTDEDDDFEILDETDRETFEVIENESFEILPCHNKSSSSSSSSTNAKPISSESLIKKPIPSVTKPDYDRPIPAKTTIRYGSAAIIPFNDNSDLTSILTCKTPILPSTSTNLLDYLQNEKMKTKFSISNPLDQILNENEHERETRLRVAKQIQQDFLKSIHLD